MKFTETERKILILAMDPGAQEGEIDVASMKFIDLLRTRFADGHAFFKENDMVNGQSRDNRDPYGEYQAGYKQGKWDAKAEFEAAQRQKESDYRKRAYSARSSFKRTETFGTSDDPSGNVPMQFGKHRGKTLRQVPMEYQAWALREVTDLNPALRLAMEQWLKVNNFKW